MQQQLTILLTEETKVLQKRRDKSCCIPIYWHRQVHVCIHIRKWFTEENLRLCLKVYYLKEKNVCFWLEILTCENLSKISEMKGK